MPFFIYLPWIVWSGFFTNTHNERALAASKTARR